MKILQESNEKRPIRSGEDAKVYVSSELKNFDSDISSIVRSLVFGNTRIDWDRVFQQIQQYTPDACVSDVEVSDAEADIKKESFNITKYMK